MSSRFANAEMVMETEEQQRIANFDDTTEFANGGKLERAWVKARKSLHLKLIERVKKRPSARTRASCGNSEFWVNPQEDLHNRINVSRTFRLGLMEELARKKIRNGYIVICATMRRWIYFLCWAVHYLYVFRLLINQYGWMNSSTEKAHQKSCGTTVTSSTITTIVCE